MTCKKLCYLMLIFIFLLVFFKLNAQTLFLNEIQSSNSTTIANSFNEYADWIELYNSSSTAINLAGYSLSDNVENLNKWSFPQGVIPAYGRLLIWASDRNMVTSGGELHTNFKISNAETIILSSPELQVLDQITLPDLAPNTSYGRLQDGASQWAYFSTPTPLLANQSSIGYLELLTPPTPNYSDGFYNNTISLEFSNPNSDAQIYYTLDCSEPIPGNNGTFIYNPNEPIIITDRSSEPNDISMIRTTLSGSSNWIDTWYPPNGLVKKATTLRVICKKSGCMDSPELYLTYFIGSAINQNYANLPVMSLITNRSNFFDNLQGIYVPGTDANGNPYPTADLANYNQGWEREVHIKLWEADRITGFQTRAICEIHGSGSSRLMRKGLRFEFKGSEGIDNLSYSLFNNGIVESYDAFVARASGQDGQHAIFRDAVAHTFFEKQGLSTSPSRPVILFINGEYWGIHNLRERSDEDYVARLYAVDVDQMDCLEHTNSSNPVARVGTNDRWMQLRTFVRSYDLNLPQNYELLKQYIDINSFINYYIAEIFVANSDWPSYNLRFWRYKPELSNPGIYYQPNPNNQYLDGKFRWILYDLDQSLGRYHTYSANTLQAAGIVGGWNDSIYLLFRKLIGATDANGIPVSDPNGTYSNGSQAFRNEFINRFCDALNTYLLPSRTTTQVTAFQNQYAPYMPEHILRWQLPANITNWNTYINGMRTFLINRPSNIRTHLTNKFHLTSGSANLSLAVNSAEQGYIILNSIKLGSNSGFEPLPFSGQYFKDVPVSIKAVPNPGFRFIGWSGITASTDSILLSLTADTFITALFDIDETEFTGDTMNPAPWNLNSGEYCFTYWSAASPSGTYPPNMRFQQTSIPDPGINVEMTIAYNAAYNLTSKSRIEGLNGGGIAFINTSDPVTNGGYNGAAVLGLRTTGLSNIKVNFTVETVLRNVREYAIVLQYRIGTEGAFTTVTQNGNDVIYVASTDGHRQTFFAVDLPSVCNNKSYVQLRWKYYYRSGSSSTRAKLRLDDILVYASNSSISGVRINEIMSSNVAWDNYYALDNQGNRSDWIELFNTTTQPVNLSGSYLSDEIAVPGKWMLPKTIISPQGYLLIRASDANLQSPESTLHANFKISSTGEAIYFTNRSNSLIDQSPATAIPEDQVLVRIPDGADEWQIQANPTPNASNYQLLCPSDVIISKAGNTLLLQWNSVSYASSYNVYSADRPDAEVWNFEANISTPYWQTWFTDSEDRRFYIIKAMR